MRTIGNRHSLLYDNVFTKETLESAQYITLGEGRCQNSIYNGDTDTITCDAGITVGDLQVFARSHNRVILGIPEARSISVGGAISTSAHGGGYEPMCSHVRKMVISGRTIDDEVQARVAEPVLGRWAM